MSIECIKDANLEETGFKVVRFNELKSWRRTAWLLKVPDTMWSTIRLWY